MRAPDEVTVRKLEVLLRYMDGHNLGAAAAQLGVATASVHRALRSLEEALRCPLFRHGGRRLLPTPATQVLAHAAREALGLVADGIEAARAVGAGSARCVRIGALHSLTVATVPRLLARMKERRPALDTELVLGSSAGLLGMLKAGTADLALTVMPVDEPDIDSHALFSDELYFAAPARSKYAGLAAIDLAACADESFLSLDDGFTMHDGLLAACRRAGFAPRVALQVGDVFTLMNLVGAGLGCSLLPGRLREALPQRVHLIPLDAHCRVPQCIGVSVVRARAQDLRLREIASMCRSLQQDV